MIIVVPLHVVTEATHDVASLPVKKAIYASAAVVSLLGAMVSGWPGGAIWLVGLLAALIMVRRSWREP